MTLDMIGARWILAQQLHENWVSKHERSGYNDTETDDSLTNLSWLCRLTAHPTPGDCEPESPGMDSVLSINGGDFLKQESCDSGYMSQASVGREESVFTKPPYSYTTLISMAIKASSEGRLSLAEIYRFISDQFPYYSSAPLSWQNSIRHSLSLNKCFMKVARRREQTGTGKGGLWMIDPNFAHLVSDNKKGYNNDCYRRTLHTVQSGMRYGATKRPLDENNNVEVKQLKQRRVDAISAKILKKGMATTMAQPRGVWDETEAAVMGLSNESVPSPTNSFDDLPIINISNLGSSSYSATRTPSTTINSDDLEDSWSSLLPTSIEVGGVKVKTETIMTGDADFSVKSAYIHPQTNTTNRVRDTNVDKSYFNPLTDDDLSCDSPPTDYSGYSTPTTEFTSDIPPFEMFPTRAVTPSAQSANIDTLGATVPDIGLNQWWDKDLGIPSSTSKPILNTVSSTGSSEYDTESQLSESRSYLDDVIDNFHLHYDLNLFDL